MPKGSAVLSPSFLKWALAGVTVLLTAFLAYQYFRTQASIYTRENEVNQTESQWQQELIQASLSTALPTEHVVSAGETLWKIGEKYYSSGYNWVDIATSNSLKSPNMIFTGQKLQIPKVEPKKITVGTMVPEIRQSEIAGQKYTVQQGDSLWTIAQKVYQDPYKWSIIAAKNRLSLPNLIHQGNILVL